jgi:hypothetical protein
VNTVTGSWCGVFDKETNYGLDDQGTESQQRHEIIPLFFFFYTGTETHTASYVVGIGVLSPGLKQPGRDVDCSRPSSVEVKNE